MSDLIQELLQHRSADKADGSRLEMMGKQAADLWSSGVARNLSDAVVQTVKTASLSQEQVRRVIEFTNIEAYHREFRKEGSPNKVINFEGGPADPCVIFQDLNGGSHTADYGSSDYDTPPKSKVAAAEHALASAFASSGAEYPEENPYGEVIELRDKLASEHGRLTSELSHYEALFQETSQRLYGHVKQAALSGHALSEIVHIWNGIAPDPIYVKTAMDAILSPLVENGVLTDAELIGSLSKVAAHRVPNPNHPLVQDFGAYCESLSKLAAMREMQEEVGNALGDLTVFLKTALTAGEAGQAVGGAARKALDLAGRGGSTAGRFLGGMVGREGAGAAVGSVAGKAALVGTGAIGANEAYRRTLKYDPTFQGAVQTLREATPGTNEYYQKEYQLATGG